MPITTPSKWDFSPVHELFESFKQQDAASAATRDSDYILSLNTPPAADDHDPSKQDKPKPARASLGDFSKLWETLGVKPPASIPTFEAATRKPDIDSYVSDSGLPKNVRWRDQELENAELEDTYDDSPPTDEPALTKNQRKKRNRKARKEAEYAQLVENLTRTKKGEIQESGDDTDVPTAARQRSLSPKSPPKIIQSHTQPKRVARSQKAADASLSADDMPRRSHTPGPSIRPAQVAPPKSSAAPATPTRPASTPRVPQSEPKPAPKVDQWPVARPYEEFKRSVIPGFSYTESRPAPKNNSIQLPSSNIASVQEHKPSQHHNRHEIKPLAFQNADDRHWSLLLKLLKQFPEDKSALLSPLSLSINRPNPQGIHVFIDASNILIGFQKALKHARRIPENARVPRVYPSFHALALLLERRRSTCKRVLVGSSPRIAAYEEAVETGYETSILDRVYKAKEMTDRQRYFAQRDGARHGHSSGYESSDGNHAVSEPQPQPTWREQGVDEILHLKMAESLIDTDCPAVDDAEGTSNTARPTMVLATGDAAVAEYSSGFLKMVQRALSRGWNVEVASWSLGLSSEYLNLERKGNFQGRFRVILLDDFAEEIFPSTD